MSIHPFLFAVYIVVSMYANNAAQVPVGHMFRPLVFFLMLAGVTYWVIFRLSKDLNYAAYATSWILLWFGLFGQLFQAVNVAAIAARSTGNEFVTLIAWTFIMSFLGMPLAWRSIRNKKLVNDFLTAVAVGAAVFPAFTAGGALYNNYKDSKTADDWLSRQTAIPLAASADAPDVYYIILDGYGRADILMEDYQFDNSNFLTALQERGFYTAVESRSNYMQTSLSLASALNLDYVNFLSSTGGDNRAPAYNLIEFSRVRSALDEAGYETINVASPVLHTQLRSYDQYLAPGNAVLTEFEKLLLSISSIAPLARDSNLLLPGYETHRVYTAHSFDVLERVAAGAGPKFVFAHIVAPHPPFVFDAEGHPVESEMPYVLSDGSGFPGGRKDYIQGYISEMIHINRLTLQAVDAILQNSSQPSIIIIQGDHGPGAYTNLFDIEKSCHRERGSILNAYYLPSRDYSSIPPDITPVNTFRLIFNRYFGTNLPMLENHVYFSYWDDPYNFVDVTNRMDQPCQP